MASAVVQATSRPAAPVALRNKLTAHKWRCKTAFVSAAPALHRLRADVICSAGSEQAVPAAAATEPKPDPFATKEQYRDGLFAKLMIWCV